MNQPMTKKARAAIEAYVNHQGNKHGRYGFVLIDACLKAERMKRDNLYKILENWGYRWKQGRWVEGNKKK